MQLCPNRVRLRLSRSELLSILNKFADPPSEARRREIEHVIRHHAQYEDMAKRSLGASRGQLEDAAQRDYVGLFVQLLRDALANRMTEYDGTNKTAYPPREVV